MSQLNIDKNTPVCVTGATGYVAGWIVKRLLDEGLTVHATAVSYTHLTLPTIYSV